VEFYSWKLFFTTKYLTVIYMVVNTPWSYKKIIFKNTRRTLKAQPHDYFKNTKMKPWEICVEEEKKSGEDRDFNSLIRIFAAYDGFTLLFWSYSPSPLIIYAYQTLDEVLLLFLKLDLLTTWVVRDFPFLNFPYTFLLEVFSLINSSLIIN